MIGQREFMSGDSVVMSGGEADRSGRAVFMIGSRMERVARPRDMIGYEAERVDGIGFLHIKKSPTRIIAAGLSSIELIQLCRLLLLFSKSVAERVALYLRLSLRSPVGQYLDGCYLSPYSSQAFP